MSARIMDNLRLIHVTAEQWQPKNLTLWGKKRVPGWPMPFFTAKVCASLKESVVGTNLDEMTIAVREVV